MREIPWRAAESEASSARRPAELYHIYISALASVPGATAHYYYTSADRAVTYGGQDYTPATIQRGEVEDEGSEDPATLRITFGRIAEAVADYVASQPVEDVAVEVLKVFPSLASAEAVFIGRIQAVRISGLALEAECVSLESLFDRPALSRVYSPACSWTVFESGCGLDRSAHKVETDTDPVTVESAGLVLKSVDWNYKQTPAGPVLLDPGAENDHWAGGYVEFEGRKAWIVSCEIFSPPAKAILYLRHAVLGLETGDSADAYPGCDGVVATCRDKFANVAKFGGCPRMPLDDPYKWSSLVV